MGWWCEGSESAVIGGFVGLVAFGFELEGAVLDVEVFVEAFGDVVEDAAGAAVPDRGRSMTT